MFVELLAPHVLVKGVAGFAQGFGGCCSLPIAVV